jgi:hypothetical protein
MDLLRKLARDQDAAVIAVLRHNRLRLRVNRELAM